MSVLFLFFLSSLEKEKKSPLTGGEERRLDDPEHRGEDLDDGRGLHDLEGEVDGLVV